jgi:hypothetical protein
MFGKNILKKYQLQQIAINTLNPHFSAGSLLSGKKGEGGIRGYLGPWHNKNYCKKLDFLATLHLFKI